MVIIVVLIIIERIITSRSLCKASPRRRDINDIRWRHAVQHDIIVMLCTWGVGYSFTNYIFRKPLTFKHHIEFRLSGNICSNTMVL